jgi:DNA topoisomerase-2
MSKIVFEDEENINDNSWEGKCLELHDQVLLRPDTYIGSTQNEEKTTYIYDNETNKIISKTITINPGVERLIEEVLSNVIDNKTRSDEKKIPMKKIKVYLGKDKFTVWNDGYTIPIKKFENSQKYCAEMAFCNLLTSTNYDDTKERKTSGRNGLGGKLVNIFSSSFEVRTYNKLQKTLYTQKCSNNMKNISPPIITKNPKDLNKDDLKGFTEISWKIDFSKFEMKSYTPDILSLFKRFCYDCAMVSKVPLYFSTDKEKEHLLPVKDLLSYASLYTNENDEENEGDEEIKKKKKEIIFLSSTDEFNNYSEVVLISSEGKGLENISFVNGCPTPNGGVHVNSWCEEIFRPITEKINTKGTRKKKEEKKEKKTKKITKERPKINIGNIKDNFIIFVNSWLDKPKFKSQSKEELTYPKMIVKVEEKIINKLMKWSFVSKIEDLIKMKEFMSLKTTQAKKGESIILSGYDKANKAGKESGCILVITEGLSAKSTLSGGLSVGMFGKKGRDYIGLYAVQGKILNCRGVKPTQIAKNKEVVGLIKILKLQYGEDYKDDTKFNKLPYHKLCILSDADDDGIHIRGLVINLFDALFPSLLEREFVYIMNTPILRINNKKDVKMFYNQQIGKQYIINNNVPKTITKYFKGLGTWKSELFKEICGKNINRLVLDKDGKRLINTAFNKKLADIRKQWIANKFEFLNFNEEKGNEYKNKPIITDLSVSTFIEMDLMEFFRTLCSRSLPDIYDGLKESQRKILYACFKNNLSYKKKSEKLVQVGSMVTKCSNYHYGEQNLYDTAGRMAQNFVGSNNIPLLYNDGQFGTRLNNKDMASPRYIYTKLNYLTEYIFNKEDFVLLNYKEEEGMKIEPTCYFPIIPMVLVNGCIIGIGSGWSCKIPAYNVEHLIEWIKVWLKYDGKVVVGENGNECITKENTVGEMRILETPDLTPWYRGFTGKIDIEEKRIITRGVINKIGDNEYQITEIPIQMWIDSVKENLEKMESEKKIKKFTNNCSKKDENSIDFVIKTDKKPTLKELKLEKSIQTNNMVLISEDEKGNNIISKYINVELILDEYCKKRYKFYTLRKNYKLDKLNEELVVTNNKIRFINDYIEETIVINRRKRVDIDKDLTKMNYDKFESKKKKKNKKDDEDEIEEEKKEVKNYDYLWELKLEHLTIEKMEKLKKKKNEIESLIKCVKDKNEKEMWIGELDEFLSHYKKWLKML